MFVVKQVPVCNFILLIFACVVLRKVHVQSWFTLETVGLLFLDSDKHLNQCRLPAKNDPAPPP